MSHRQLSRMKPEEVTAIIESRASNIRDAEEAQARLEERKQFAERVSRELKYNELSTAMQREKIDVPVDVVLLKALDSLGIRPLDRASVMQYQKAMAGNSLNLFLKGFGFPLLFSGILATAIVIWAAFKDAAAIEGALRVHWIWPALLGVGFFMTWAEHAIIPRRSWERRSLDGHSLFAPKGALLPREVLELSLRIREALPKVEFEVHSLERSYGPKALLLSLLARLLDDLASWGSSLADPDPFLLVRFGGESYFIAVWNEPGFDGKLIDVG